jgi:hypothetical protein
MGIVADSFFFFTVTPWWYFKHCVFSGSYFSDLRIVRSILSKVVTLAAKWKQCDNKKSLYHSETWSF